MKSRRYGDVIPTLSANGLAALVMLNPTVDMLYVSDRSFMEVPESIARPTSTSPEECASSPNALRLYDNEEITLVALSCTLNLKLNVVKVHRLFEREHAMGAATFESCRAGVNTAVLMCIGGSARVRAIHTDLQEDVGNVDIGHCDMMILDRSDFEWLVLHFQAISGTPALLLCLDTQGGEAPLMHPPQGGFAPLQPSL